MQKPFLKCFSYNLPTGTSSSVQKILYFANIFCKNFILQALFQSAQHIYEKRKGSGSGFVPLNNGSGSGRPKNMRDPQLSSIFSRKHKTCFASLYLFTVSPPPPSLERLLFARPNVTQPNLSFHLALDGWDLSLCGVGCIVYILYRPTRRNMLQS
jgi:hypothetical protein